METFDPHKSTTEVRQGNRKKMNLRVLVLSFIGIVVLFALIYFLFAAQPDGTVTSTMVPPEAPAPTAPAEPATPAPTNPAPTNPAPTTPAPAAPTP